MRTYELQHMRPHEILDAKREKSIVYLPIAPLEWHGPALPLGVDSQMAEYMAKVLANHVGGVVMPTVYCGTERERSPEMLDAFGFEDTSLYIVGQDFPKNTVKSMYSKEDVYAFILREYLRILVEQEYKLIVIVNGHGSIGQIDVINRLSVEFSNETNSKVISCLTMPDNLDLTFMGHANISETSIQMFICNDDVDLTQLPPRDVKLKNCDWGIDDVATFFLKPNNDKTVQGDPRDATVELGRKVVEDGMKHAIKMIEDVYSSLL